MKYEYVYVAWWTERENNYYIVLTPPQAPQRHTEHLLFNPIISIRPGLYDEN